MGVDLVLLPITENEEKTWGYTLHDLLRALPNEPVPADFATYVSKVPDGSSQGESCYGTVTEDSYGTPLRCVRVGEIVANRIERIAREKSQNRAVWAYLAALPPDTRVALYWD